MRPGYLHALRFTLTACAVILAASACAPAVRPSGSASVAASQTPVPRGAPRKVEILDFRGKRLDAAMTQRETSIGGPQKVDIPSYRLSVVGMVRTPLRLTYGQVLSLPAYEKVTTLNCVEGWSVTHLWQGVRLVDLLERAGYDPSAKTLVFRCYDGYFVSLPLDYVVKRDILLAYRVNGMDLAPERGFPFQVLAEDRYGYKWAKWVTSIEATYNTSFRGFWEQRGYDNEAVVPGGRR